LPQAPQKLNLDVVAIEESLEQHDNCKVARVHCDRYSILDFMKKDLMVRVSVRIWVPSVQGCGDVVEAMMTGLVASLLPSDLFAPELEIRNKPTIEFTVVAKVPRETVCATWFTGVPVSLVARADHDPLALADADALILQSNLCPCTLQPSPVPYLFAVQCGEQPGELLLNGLVSFDQFIPACWLPLRSQSPNVVEKEMRNLSQPTLDAGDLWSNLFPVSHTARAQTQLAASGRRSATPGPAAPRQAPPDPRAAVPLDPLSAWFATSGADNGGLGTRRESIDPPAKRARQTGKSKARPPKSRVQSFVPDLHEEKHSEFDPRSILSHLAGIPVSWDSA